MYNDIYNTDELGDICMYSACIQIHIINLLPYSSLITYNKMMT